MSNNNNPLVSIVLPTYNGSHWLVQSIDSVLNQSYQNIELIVVDDCSTDETPVILKEISKKDERVKLLRHSINRKLPISLNDGFSLAKGVYLSWTSDDNWYERTAIAELVNFLDNNRDNGMVCADYKVYQDDTYQKTIVTDPSIKSLAYKNTIGACFLYRKSIAEDIGEYDPDFFLAEDYDYWLRVASCTKIGHLDKILYNYRFHSMSLTQKRREEVRYKDFLLKFKYYPIFADRFHGIDLTGMKSVFNFFTSFNKLINELKDVKEKIYIYGAGDFGYILYMELEKNHIAADGFFDVKAKQKPFSKLGRKVNDINDVILPNGCYILIASDKYANEIENTIINYSKNHSVNIKICKPFSALNNE